MNTDIETNKSALLPHEVWFAAFVLCSWFFLVLHVGMFSSHTWPYTILLLTNYFIIKYCLESQSDSAWQVRLMFYPIAIVILNFILADTIAHINAWQQQGFATAVQNHVFDLSLTIYLQKWSNQWLTTLLACCYMLFYLDILQIIVKPIFIDINKAKSFFVGLCLVGILVLACHVLFPILQPYQALNDSYTLFHTSFKALHFLQHMIVMMAVPNNAFPSFEVAIALYLLIYNFHYKRSYFYWQCLPYLGLVYGSIYFGFDYIQGTIIALFIACFSFYKTRQTARQLGFENDNNR